MADVITKKREKVLLIEDEPMVAIKEASVLEDRGYQVEKCYTGEQAVELTERDEAICLALIDIDLGEGIDGAEVARRIRGIRNIPIVFLTGHGEKSFVDRVRKVPHYGYVLKSAGEEVLLDAVDRSLDQAMEREKLEQRAGNLDWLWEHLPAGVMLLDTEARLLDATAAAREFVGIGGAFPQGKRIGAALRCRNDREAPDGCGTGEPCKVCGLRKALEETIKTRDRRRREVTGLPLEMNGDCREHTLLLSASVAEEYDNRPLILILEDLTEIERIHVLCREKERQFRLIADNMTDVITIADPEFNFTYVSPSNEKMSGYTPEEMKQMSIRDLLTPESFEKVMELRRERPEAFTSSLRLELEHVRKDGSVFWTEEMVNPMLDGNGEVIGFLTVSRDITERKLIEDELRESEERFRLLAENAKAMICRVSLPHGKIEYINHSFKQILFPDIDELPDFDYYLDHIIHPDWRDWAKWKWRQVLEGDAEESGEYQIVVPGGETRWVSHTSTIVVDSSGKPSAVDSVVIDITELKQKEEELAKLAREKHNLMIEINHRVKNNLATVEALAMIELSKEDKTKQESIKDIINRVKAINLIHEKLYRTENFSAINIADYLQDLVQLLASSLTEEGSNYRFRHDFEPIEFPVKANTPMGIITAELLTNTFKYAEFKEECEIYLSLRKVGENIIYTYRDSGTGLRGKVSQFEDLPDGTGTLLIRELVKGLGGTITLNTENCTEFKIVFPAP